MNGLNRSRQNRCGTAQDRTKSGQLVLAEGRTKFQEVDNISTVEIRDGSSAQLLHRGLLRRVKLPHKLVVKAYIARRWHRSKRLRIAGLLSAKRIRRRAAATTTAGTRRATWAAPARARVESVVRGLMWRVDGQGRRKGLMLLRLVIQVIDDSCKHRDRRRSPGSVVGGQINIVVEQLQEGAVRGLQQGVRDQAVNM